MPLSSLIESRKPDIVGWRRHLHAHPELGFQEHQSSAFVAAKLDEWGIPYARLAKTGIVATLKKGTSSRAIGLRADMDALPMEEKNTFAWRSTAPGVMHACGHDGHTATMMATAEYLAKQGNFDGTVHIIFQPAEEGLAGAKVMIDEGLFERFPCDLVFGAHNDPALAVGTMSVVPGTVMAASDRFSITVTGKGGHAARPHQTVDPVIAGAQVALSLQTILSRRTDPVESAVISITQFHAGTADNVIPDTAELRGTVRTFLPQVQADMERLMKEVAGSAAATLGASAEVDYRVGYPPVVNDIRATEIAAQAAIATLGQDAVMLRRPPLMGGEDFAFMALARPACFVRIGNAGADRGAVALHNSGYDYNDDALVVGASFFANLAESYLAPSAG